MQALTLLAGAALASAAAHTVTIEGMKFVPESLTVRPGDTVIWFNKDIFPHTATAQPKGFDSREIKAGGKWKHIARKSGTYPYICTLHPTMKGVLTVK